MPLAHLVNAGATQSRTRAAAPRRAIDVAVLAYRGVFGSPIAGAIDAMEIANVVCSLFDRSGEAPRLSPRVIAPRAGALQLSRHLTVNASAPGARAPDVLIVPPPHHREVRELRGAIDALDAERALVADCFARGAIVASQCAGAFLVGAAGLLDGRRATTSWWLGEGLRKQFPRVRLELDRLLVEDGRLWSTGPAESQFALYLRIVQRFCGAELATICGQVWAAEPGREMQTAYARHAATGAISDPLVLKAIGHAERELARELTLADLAAAAATSPRTLIRRFRAAVDDTPLGYLQKLRIDRAKRLLATSSTSIERVMERVGYADTSAFRRAFRAHAGVTPAEYRARFRLRGRRESSAGTTRVR